MRRTLAFASALVLTSFLSACGDNDDGSDDGDDDDGGTPACGDIEGNCIELTPAGDGGDGDQIALQTALIEAEPGDVILMHAGTYEFQLGLSLDIDDVTLRGEGEAETILSFDGQEDGAEGLLVAADGFTVEDLAVENTAGDAIKVNGGSRIVFRRVRTEWTGGPSEENGAYGIYPVQCADVLIEDSIVIGASDAGIYVGQSERAVVRRNRVEGNVAGIEIENTFEADVYENVATGNTGGILVFNLPGLDVQNGAGTRVFDNEIVDNNQDNFAPAGNTVALVPAGTGFMALAAHQIEVFDNVIADNQSANVLIVSYIVTMLPITDENYDPYPDVLDFHDNELAGGGTMPSGDLELVWGVVTSSLDPAPEVMPDFVFDGVLDPDRTDEKSGQYLPEFAICIRDNGDADFLNIDFGNGFANINLDASPHDCVHDPVPAVELMGVEL
jgi:parallel beta-helix repeat protein